jgi:Circularly permutated YpsA SLOG family
VQRIVSGGQTGADRAALDVGLALGLDVGGWVPLGRLAEDGTIPSNYPGLIEAATNDPSLRTRLNVRDSDATLILSHGELAGGSKLTKEIAAELGKPWKHVDLASRTSDATIHEIQHWLAAVNPRVLNIAGPRASEDPDIYAAARVVLQGAFMNEAADVS